jgi:hypothetical protein
MTEAEVSALIDKYVALAMKYSDLVDRYLDFRQAVLDPENQPSQYGTTLIDAPIVKYETVEEALEDTFNMKFGAKGR